MFLPVALLNRHRLPEGKVALCREKPRSPGLVQWLPTWGALPPPSPQDIQQCLETCSEEHGSGSSVTGTQWVQGASYKDAGNILQFAGQPHNKELSGRQCH